MKLTYGYYNLVSKKQGKKPSDVEIYILISTYKWHMVSRWYTSEFHAVTIEIQTYNRQWLQCLHVGIEETLPSVFC